MSDPLDDIARRGVIVEAEAWLRLTEAEALEVLYCPNPRGVFHPGCNACRYADQKRREYEALFR